MLSVRIFRLIYMLRVLTVERTGSSGIACGTSARGAAAAAGPLHFSYCTHFPLVRGYSKIKIYTVLQL